MAACAILVVCYNTCFVVLLYQNKTKQPKQNTTHTTLTNATKSANILTTPVSRKHKITITLHAGGQEGFKQKIPETETNLLMHKK